MRRRMLFLALIILLIASLLTGCGGKKAQLKEEKTSLVVEVAEVEKRDIVYKTEITGAITADKDVTITPEINVPIRVESIPVKVGDRVEKGDVLIKLKQDEIRAQLKQAEAAFLAAKAGKEKALSQFENAKVNLERMEKLYEEGAISKQTLDQARLQYDLNNPESVEAELKRTRAALESARFQLEHTIITSPISGTVTAINTEEGEMVSPGVPVARVVQMDQVYIESAVTENHINSLKAGGEVEVNIPALSEGPIKGVVHTLSPAADPQTRTYPVEIKIDNREHRIKPGMFAEIDLPLVEKKGVVAVPVKSLVERNGKEGVFVVEGEKAVFKEIQRGIDDGLYVEVLAGIKPGEQLVVTGQHSLTDGTGVKVIGRGEE